MTKFSTSGAESNRLTLFLSEKLDPTRHFETLCLVLSRSYFGYLLVKEMEWR